MIHIHARRPDGTPSYEVEDFRATTEAIRADLAQWMLVAAALTLGGCVRVGLEDNLYLPDGTMARSNGELVARARRMTQDAGRRVATVAEAREMLAV